MFLSETIVGSRKVRCWQDEKCKTWETWLRRWCIQENTSPPLVSGSSLINWESYWRLTAQREQHLEPSLCKVNFGAPLMHLLTHASSRPLVHTQHVLRVRRALCLHKSQCSACFVAPMHLRDTLSQNAKPVQRNKLVSLKKVITSIKPTDCKAPCSCERVW